MGALALAYESDPQYQDICEYLGAENGFWIKNDIWKWAKTHPNERLLIEDTRK